MRVPRDLRRKLRELVVRTGSLPGIGHGYRGIYALQTARIRRALAGVPGIEAVLLRGSLASRVTPGLSDIDLVVVLDASMEIFEELECSRRIHAAVARVNVGAPLIRDVHVFSRLELTVLGELSEVLFVGIQRDTVPILGKPELPACSTAPELVREALLRQLYFRLGSTLEHLFDDDHVARGLAARALSKATIAAAELDRNAKDLIGLWEGYRSSLRVTADPEAVVELLRRADSLVHPVKPFDFQEQRAPHPAIDASRELLREWVRPIAHAPAVLGALLSVEGARENDLRLYVLIDAEHARATEVLFVVRDRLASAPFPSRHFTRFAGPILVTPRQLERAVFLRWTALEPVARLRHGVSLFGEAPTPLVSRAEMFRALALDLVGAGTGARELLSRSIAGRASAEIADIWRGLVPAAKELATSGRFVTRSEERSPPEELERKPFSRENAIEVLSAIRSAQRETLDTLLFQARVEGA